MQPGTHKKIVFGALGCGGLLVVLMVVSFLSVGKSGFDMPQTQQPVAPLQAAVAIDSLSAYDLAALLAPRGADSLLPAPASLPALVARWSGDRRVMLMFGDTFPPDSWQGKSWRDDGAAVVIDSLRAGATPPPADSQPAGHALLAAARVALDSGEVARAREAVGLAVRGARALQARTDLLAVIAGLRLERDAARMVGADSVLAGTGGARARAAATVVALDRRLDEVRQVRALIAAAGASPAEMPALAEWVRDSTQPLAVRDEFIHAIAYGWLLDPPEMTFGLDAARVAAMQRLAEADLPPALRQTVRVLTLGRPGMVQRFNLSLSYRTRRVESLDF